MIKDAVYELYKKAAIVLGNDVKKALEDALKVEDNKLARLNIEAILKNIKLAEEKQIPMCQDTGLPVIFVKMGNVEVENLRAGIEEGIKVSNKIMGDLEYMADYVQIMLTRGFGSFCNQDISVARELASDDDKVDDLFDIILSHTTELLTEKSQNALEIVNIIFIARYLERIADRVVNIGERVIFINTHKRPHIEELNKEEQ